MSLAIPAIGAIEAIGAGNPAGTALQRMQQAAQNIVQQAETDNEATVQAMAGGRQASGARQASPKRGQLRGADATSLASLPIQDTVECSGTRAGGQTSAAGLPAGNPAATGQGVTGGRAAAPVAATHKAETPAVSVETTGFRDLVEGRPQVAAFTVRAAPGQLPNTARVTWHATLMITESGRAAPMPDQPVVLNGSPTKTSPDGQLQVVPPGGFSSKDLVITGRGARTSVITTLPAGSYALVVAVTVTTDTKILDVSSHVCCFAVTSREAGPGSAQQLQSHDHAPHHARQLDETSAQLPENGTRTKGDTQPENGPLYHPRHAASAVTSQEARPFSALAPAETASMERPPETAGPGRPPETAARIQATDTQATGAQATRDAHPAPPAEGADHGGRTPTARGLPEGQQLVSPPQGDASRSDEAASGPLWQAAQDWSPREQYQDSGQTTGQDQDSGQDCGIDQPSAEEQSYERQPDQQVRHDGMTIATLTPNHGCCTGGTAVTIYGDDFPDRPFVSFGGANVYVLSHTPVRLTVLAPSGTPGSMADATISDSTGRSVTMTSAFRYE